MKYVCEWTDRCLHGRKRTNGDYFQFSALLYLGMHLGRLCIKYKTHIGKALYLSKGRITGIFFCGGWRGRGEVTDKKGGNIFMNGDYSNAVWQPDESRQNGGLKPSYISHSTNSSSPYCHTVVDNTLCVLLLYSMAILHIGWFKRS